MMNFKVFALFISVSVTSLGRNSAVPFSSLRDEASAGEYNFYDMHVAAWKLMCSRAASEHSFLVF